MKKFFLALLTAVMSFGSVYAETVQSLSINGQPVDKTVTKIHFEGDNVVLHFGDETESHDMNTVALSFVTMSGIDDAEMFTFNGYVDGSTAVVSGVGAGTQVTVYSIAGVAVAQAAADEDGVATVDVSSLEGGVYLLVAGKNVVKFVKR